MKRITTFIAAVLLATLLLADNNATYYQTVHGVVIDQDAKSPLVRTNVILLGANPVTGTSPDGNGTFRIENIPIGRTSVQLTYLGYESKTITNILI